MQDIKCFCKRIIDYDLRLLKFSYKQPKKLNSITVMLFIYLFL